ncbi:MAG TPA: hypothetical protein VNF49_04090, partial [Candidatus Binataceae bacterium]|nr:hypothetical protein [Candidatus Binataceae bacterium]
MDWQKHYESRRLGPEAAAALVKPGMRVHFPLAASMVMQRALCARAEQIGGAIDLRLSAPLGDAGWLGRDLSAIFRIEFEFFIGNIARPAHDRHLGSYLPNLLSTSFKPHDERPAEDKPVDITFVETTPPNAQGFVSFGPHQWNKRLYARRARIAVALTDATLIRTHGDVYL